ncbi:MAG TPA: baseplate J/gp47 family protein, partial [Methanothrix sp.]|nr:baseplate J/gp47 family protein [Methanothrix sp.]
ADPDKGLLIFGNGNPANRSGHGRVPISSSIITATYREGVGVEGNIMVDMIQPIEDDADHQSIIGMTVTNINSAKKGNDATTLDEAIANARMDLREVTRCITASDYETLAMMCPRVKLAWVKALPLFHPTLGDSVFDLVSVVIVPESDVMPPVPSKTDLTRVRNYLEQFRTIGTNLYVIQPNYTRVKIKAKVVRDFRYLSDDVEKRVKEALHNFLNPLTGGPDGDGWPFGRPVYMSEIMQVIDNVAGVDHVVLEDKDGVETKIESWSDEVGNWVPAGNSDGAGPLQIDSHGLVYSQNQSDHVIDAKEAVT